jgi:hypothetical protein
VVACRSGERRVAGDDGRIERLCQGHVHGAVRGDVVPQLSRASQQIEMRVTLEVEVSEVRNRFGRALG